MNTDIILNFKPKLNDGDIIYRRKEKHEFESIAFKSSVRSTPMIFETLDIKIIEMFNGKKNMFYIICKLTNINNFNEVLQRCLELCMLFNKLKIGNFNEIKL